MGFSSWPPSQHSFRVSGLVVFFFRVRFTSLGIRPPLFFSLTSSRNTTRPESLKTKGKTDGVLSGVVAFFHLKNVFQTLSLIEHRGIRKSRIPGLQQWTKCETPPQVANSASESLLFLMRGLLGEVALKGLEGVWERKIMIKEI